MKTHQISSAWSVRSAIHGNGKRVITLSRAPGPDGTQPAAVTAPPAGPRTRGMRLKVEFVPEELSAFKPRLRARAPVRRRVFNQPKLQFLGVM